MILRRVILNFVMKKNTRLLSNCFKWYPAQGKNYKIKNEIWKCDAKVLHTVCNDDDAKIKQIYELQTSNSVLKKNILCEYKIKENKALDSVNRFTFRTYNCGQLRIEDVGKEVVLFGWLEYRRMNKFFTLRDAYGSTQCILPNYDEKLISVIENTSIESVLHVEGVVEARPSNMKNNNMATGEIEIHIKNLVVLNDADKKLPFNIREHNKAKESLRLQNRYLDLRFPNMQYNLRMRSKYLMDIREFLIRFCGFVDVETPTLFRKTPGGAQEFIVPTQVPGKCYSLVQSPQQFKQMLMVGGIDRYFQIARCYRDEGGRSDRQPEFTQLDIEMSFVDRNGVMELIEDLIVYVWSELGVTRPFIKLTYKEAISKYGTDKPDMRYDFQIQDCTNEFIKDETFFQYENFGAYAIPIDESLNSKLSTSFKSKITDIASQYSSVKVIKSNLPSDRTECVSKMTKMFGHCIAENLFEALHLSSKNVLFIVYGKKDEALTLLGKIRVAFIEYMEQTLKKPLKKFTDYCFVWIVDFPLFEKDVRTGSLLSAHHPFSQPHPDDLYLLKNDPLKVRGLTYDLVLNGVEVGGGSIRIHDPILQEYILEILKINPTELIHLLKALKSGCPPHGGIALGLDRLLATILKTNSIRDVIAFPKGADGQDLLSGAPAHISRTDERLYHLKIVE